MRRLLSFNFVLCTSLLLVVALLLPALNVGLQITDFFHRAILLHELPIAKPNDPSLFGLFSFFDGTAERLKTIENYGAYPWWGMPGVRVSFFRPLAELSHWLDYALWPDSPAMLHAHSIAWYLADIIIVGIFLRQLFREKSPHIATIAVAFLALCGAHSETVVWIACRNALISTFFTVLTLMLHDRWRQNASPRTLLAALAALTTALLSAEYGLASIAYLVAYALFLDRANVRAKVLSILPYFVITLIWFVFYQKSGFGPKNSGVYLSPVSDARAFLTAVVTRVPHMIGTQFSGLTLFLFSAPKLSEIAIDSLFLVFFLPVIPVLLRSREARFLVTGAIVALVPVSSGGQSDRVLLVSSLGVMAAAAEAIIYWYGRLQLVRNQRAATLVARLALVLLIAAHGVFSPLLFVPLYLLPSRLHEESVVKPVKSIQAADVAGKTVLLLNPPSIAMRAYFMPMMRSYGGAVPRNILALAPGANPVKIERIDEQTLRVTPEKGFLLKADDWYARPHNLAFRSQDVYELERVKITIESLDSSGVPQSALFRFDRPLTDSSLIWFRFSESSTNANAGSYTEWKLPEIGKTVVVTKRDT